MDRWIGSAIKRPGALRRQLGLPAKGEPIPEPVLRWASKQPGKLGQRARLAMTLRKLRKKGR